jgi:hypothetical protein
MTHPVRAFRRRNTRPAGSWLVEVDYGDGWIPYGPPLQKRAAQLFAYELGRLGQTARVTPAEPAPDEPSAVLHGE